MMINNNVAYINKMIPVATINDTNEIVRTFAAW